MSDEMMDRKLRELTYRLVEMAPEAPPFPEAPVVKLAQQPTHRSALPPRRRPWLALGAAAVIVLALVAVPLFLLGPDDETIAPPATTVAPETTLPPETTAPTETTTAVTTTPDSVPPTETTPATTVPSATAAFEIFLFSDDVRTPIGDAGLVPVTIEQAFESDPSVEVLAGEAIRALVTGETAAPYSSNIPAGVTVGSVRLDGSTLIVDLSRSFESGGGTFSMTGRIAQLVFTATQFDGVDGVTLLLDGTAVDVFSGEGLILDPIMTRDAYVDTGVLPAVFISDPGVGATLPSSFTMTGLANVFEARFGYELLGPGGEMLASGFADATCGTGCWGEFAVDISYELATPGQGRLVVFTNSPRDGSRTDEVAYDVMLAG